MIRRKGWRFGRSWHRHDVAFSFSRVNLGLSTTTIHQNFHPHHHLNMSGVVEYADIARDVYREIQRNHDRGQDGLPLKQYLPVPRHYRNNFSEDRTWVLNLLKRALKRMVQVSPFSSDIFFFFCHSNHLIGPHFDRSQPEATRLGSSCGI